MPWSASLLSVGVLIFAAEGRCLAEADVVDQDDQHVWRIFAQMVRFDASHVLRILQAWRCEAGGRRARKRKNGAIGQSAVLRPLGKCRTYKDE